MANTTTSNRQFEIIEAAGKILSTSGTITTEELMHIVMGSFRLQMFKWRIANFQFDIERQGKNMLYAISTLIKN